jgi:ABC-type uncharacterized transport system permease subunit
MQATIATAHNAAPARSEAANTSAAASRARLWTGRALSGLALLFLAFDSVMKLLQLAPAVEGTVELGYPASSLLTIGILEITCVVAYAIPRISVLGAVLLTGYLGGAIATHVRVENPLFSHTLFPIYIAALIWGGLYLRDARVRALLGAPRA